MLTEFNKENEAFINSKKSPSEAVAPWVGYADEETLKEQILALSTVRTAGRRDVDTAALATPALAAAELITSLREWHESLLRLPAEKDFRGSKCHGRVTV